MFINLKPFYENSRFCQQSFFLCFYKQKYTSSNLIEFIASIKHFMQQISCKIQFKQFQVWKSKKQFSF